MSCITTHVLDTSLGRPVSGLNVELARAQGDHWIALKKAATDTDGRIQDLLAADAFSAGTYRLRFETGDYFALRGQAAFYPLVDIVFTVEATDSHYHVPLLLSPFGYSTYRGS